MAVGERDRGDESRTVLIEGLALTATESEIRRLLATKRVFLLKAELSTHPKFFYFYS